MTQNKRNRIISIEEAIEQLTQGKMLVVTDDENRENEGDLFLPAAFANQENVNFMITHGRGLLCVATTEERRDRRAHDEGLARQLLAVGPRRFVEAWYAHPFWDTLRQDPERFRRILERRRTLDPAGLAASLRWMGTGAQPSLWSRLGSITAPVLLITGEKDAKFRSFAGAMHGRMPRASHALVPGAGHNVHLERPREYTRLVSAFLGKTAG